MSFQKTISLGILTLYSTAICLIAASTDGFPDTIACNDLSRSSTLTVQQDQTLATMQLQPYQKIEFDITINSPCAHDIDNGGGAYDCNVFWIGTSAAKTDRTVALWIRIRRDSGQQSWEPRFGSNNNWNHAVSITDPAPTIGTHRFSMFIAPNRVILGIDDTYTTIAGDFNRSNYFETPYNIAFGSPYFVDWGYSDAIVSNLCLTSSSHLCEPSTDYVHQPPLQVTDAQTVATMQLEPYQSIEFAVDIRSVCSHEIDNGSGANDCNILWIGTDVKRSDRAVGLWTRSRITSGEISWEPRFASNDNWNNAISITEPAPTVGAHQFAMFISPDQVIVVIDGVVAYDSSGNYNRSDYYDPIYNIAFSSPNWNEWHSANATVSNITLRSWNMDGCAEYVVPWPTTTELYTTTTELETTTTELYATTTTELGTTTTELGTTATEVIDIDTTTTMELKTTIREHMTDTESTFPIMHDESGRISGTLSMVVVFVFLSFWF